MNEETRNEYTQLVTHLRAYFQSDTVLRTDMKRQKVLLFLDGKTTINQYAEMAKVSDTTAVTHLTEAHKAGLVKISKSGDKGINHKIQNEYVITVKGSKLQALLLEGVFAFLKKEASA